MMEIRNNLHEYKVHPIRKGEKIGDKPKERDYEGKKKRDYSTQDKHKVDVRA